MNNTLSVRQADAVLEELESKRSRFAGMLAQCGSELQDAEARLGKAVLAGNHDAVREVEDLRLRCDGLNAALGELDQQKAAAELERQRAEIADFRREAQRKRDELRDLEAKTARLTGELSKLEGVTYTASILSSQPVGAWVGMDLKLNPPAYLGAHELAQNIGGAFGYAVPRSRQLRADIEDLERRAREAEQATRVPQPELAAPAPISGPVHPDPRTCACHACRRARQHGAVA